MHSRGPTGTPADAVRNPAPAADDTASGDPSPVVLRGVGGEVEVRYVRRGASTSVRVTDRHTGDSLVLDATELESLARAPDRQLRELLRDIDGGGPS